MQVTRTNSGELTATVKITVSPADYNENVNKVLKDYQRKANVPGFRPGHVPFGLIRKMYGSAVFADEVNKLVSDALMSHVRDEKLDVLGQPLPNMEMTQTFDWKEDQEIDFYFDLGLSPVFDLELNDSIEIEYNRIRVSDDMLDKYIGDLRQRHGELGNTEVAGEKDVLNVHFTELDAEGNLLEGGINTHAKLMIDTIRDEEVKAGFIGVKAGDERKFNPSSALGNTTEIANMLSIPKEQAESLTSDFRVIIEEISTMIPSEMNEEFFSKVFPGEEGMDETSFREKIRIESENSFSGDSDHYFMHLAKKKLLEITPMSLPDTFMKRWLLESNEGKLAQEDIDRDYDKYSDSMKWQLIENRLIKDNHIEVEDDEVKGFVKERYLPGWKNMNLTEDIMKRLDQLADSFLESRQDEARRLIDSLYEIKITSLIKSKVKLQEKDINYEEFIKLDAVYHQ